MRRQWSVPTAQRERPPSVRPTDQVDNQLSAATSRQTQATKRTQLPKRATCSSHFSPTSGGRVLPGTVTG